MEQQAGSNCSEVNECISTLTPEQGTLYHFGQVIGQVQWFYPNFVICWRYTMLYTYVSAVETLDQD